MTTPTVAYDPPVGRWKRPKLPTLDGTSIDTYVRGTTITGTLDDKSALDQWKMRTLIRSARARQAELTDSMSADDLLNSDTEPEVDAQTLRDYLDAVDMGATPIAAVPAPYHAYVQAFHDALTEAGVTIDPAYTNRWLVHEPTGSVTRVWRVVIAADGVTRAPLVLRTSARADYGVTSDRIAAVLAADATYRLTATHDAWDVVSPLFRDTAILVHMPTKAEVPSARLSLLDLSSGRLDLDTALAVRTARSEAKHINLGRRVRVYADGTVES